jgi:hypothetical protein
MAESIVKGTSTMHKKGWENPCILGIRPTHSTNLASPASKGLFSRANVLKWIA